MGIAFRMGAPTAVSVRCEIRLGERVTTA